MPRVIFEFEDNELFEQMLRGMQGISDPIIDEKVFEVPKWMDSYPAITSPCLSCSNYGKGPCHCTLGSSVIC